MDKRCSICTHPALPEIDLALQAGEPLRALAAQYGVSVSSLSRHTKHLRRALAAAADQAHQAALLDKLDLYEVRLDRIFRKAENATPFTFPWAVFRNPSASSPSGKKSVNPGQVIFNAPVPHHKPHSTDFIRIFNDFPP
jgi:hypothetical protein